MKIVAGMLKTIFTLLLILMLCVCVFASAGCVFASNRSMHESVATADATIDAQLEAIDQGIAALTSKYAFDPATFEAIIDRDTLKQQNLNAVAWWHAMLESNESVAVPTWTAPDVKSMLEGDEVWLNETKSSKKSVDKISKAISSLVNGTVIPMRTSIVTLGISTVQGKINLSTVIAWLPYLPIILALLVLGMTGILLICKNGASYTGSAFIAAAVLQAALLFIMNDLQIIELIGTVSPVLALQCTAVAAKLSIPLIVLIGIQLVLGVIWTIRGARVSKETV